MVINLNTFGLPLFIGKYVLPEIITKLKKTSQAQSYPPAVLQTGGAEIIM